MEQLARGGLREGHRGVEDVEALGDLRVRYVPLWAWLLEGQ
ncbi:MAG: hypothetical protein ACP5QE_04205 [Conexivisphaera sp.]